MTRPQVIARCLEIACREFRVDPIDIVTPDKKLTTFAVRARYVVARHLRAQWMSEDEIAKVFKVKSKTIFPQNELALNLDEMDLIQRMPHIDGECNFWIDEAAMPYDTCLVEGVRLQILGRGARLKFWVARRRGPIPSKPITVGLIIARKDRQILENSIFRRDNKALNL